MVKKSRRSVRQVREKGDHDRRLYGKDGI